MNLVYNNLIDALQEKFPELKGKYEENKDYLANLPHVAFENILVPYIEELSLNDMENDKLKSVFDFLEQMLLSNDEKIQEVVVVSVLEPLLSERQTVEKIRTFFGPLTAKAFNELERAYGWKK